MLPRLDDTDQKPFPQLKGEYVLVVLENGTCCYRAGEHFARAAFEQLPSLLEAGSFDQAVEKAKAANHILLLPHIHPIIGDVETDYHWQSMGDYIFRLMNPPLYLAAKTAEPASGSCASIKRLQTLIDDEVADKTSWLTTDNTQQAAKACADGRATTCITNRNGLETNGLVPLTELKAMEVCWHPYTYTNA